MNCGFEDCRILDELLEKNNEDINKCFKIFSEIRKPNGDGLQDLSMHNFIVMRDKNLDPMFFIQKKIEKNSLIFIQKMDSSVFYGKFF